MFADPDMNYGLDYIVDILFRPFGSATWLTDYSGFHRTAVWQADSEGNQIFTSHGFDHKHLLTRRVIDAAVGSAGAFKSGPAETVAKAYVNENLGPGAGTRAFTGFSVEGNSATGNSWEGDRALENVLEVLQEIAAVAGGAFDVVRVEPPNSAPQFEFRWYQSHIGTDKTAGMPNQVVFSVANGNMLVPVSSYNRSNEHTAVYVIGQNMITERVIDPLRSLESKWNVVETVRRATDETTVAALVAIGNDWLDTDGIKQSLAFQILQTNELVYGVDYIVGDTITGIYRQRVDKLFRGVNVNVSGDSYTVSVTLADAKR